LVLGMGPAIWGYAHREFEESVREQLARLAFAASSTVHTEPELELAERIVRHVPCAERVRFAISGSEAVQLSIRLARAFTGRPIVLRFEGHYHGWLDNMFGGEVNLDQNSDPLPVDRAGAPGRTEGRARHADFDTFLLPWNDVTAFDAVLDRHSSQIAMVLMEPILCNSGCCPPRPGYLEHVRSRCTAAGVLLGFDEVITGFRMALSGAQGTLGVTPDLTVLGKALAGGMPLAAVVGRRDVLDLLRSGRVLGGGTFNSFPLGIAGGLVTLRMLERDGDELYPAIDRAQQTICAAMAAAATRHGHPLLQQGPRGIFYYSFQSDATAFSVRELAGDDGKAQRFRSLALEEGLLLGGGQRIVLSPVIRPDELDDVVARIDRTFARL
jgi:glutamate-1-semialdehyde 2,1-aminomutase